MTVNQPDTRGTAHRPAPDEAGRGSRTSQAAHPTTTGDPEELAAVMRMARVVFAIVTRSGAHVGDTLTLTQLRVLVTVANATTAVSLNAVAAALDVHPSTASRLCDKVVNAGLLNRDEAPEDRRNLHLSLTENGWAVLADVMGHRRDAFAAILEQMTPQDRAQMGRLFDAFGDAADVERSILDRPDFGTGHAAH